MSVYIWDAEQKKLDARLPGADALKFQDWLKLNPNKNN